MSARSVVWVEAIMKYYIYRDGPAKWEPGYAPVRVTPSGDERVVTSLVDFMQSATPISEDEYQDFLKEVAEDQLRGPIDIGQLRR